VNIEKACLAKALQVGGIATLLARGIEPHLFSSTPEGQADAEVFQWAAEHARRHNVSPSPAFVKERWPNWHGESSSDPLEALVDAFVGNVKRRYFASKVRELAVAGDDPAQWGRLDEVLIDASRDFASLISSSRASRLSEMEARIAQYEIEKATGQPPGFELGIPAFDEMIGGIRPGNVVVLSGFLGIGKSALGGWITLNVVEQGHSALFLSLEMSRREVLERIDTMITHFSHKLLRIQQLPDEEVAKWRRLAKQFRALEHDLVVLDGLGGLTIDRLYAEISRHKPHFTVVDYVQLMRRSRASMQSWEGLVEITNECKSIALATESVIMLVSQDNREAAAGGSTLASIGGSISVGQVGDVYLGMHQDDEMRAQNRMAVKLLKVRSGPRDKTVDLLWDPAHMRFGAALEGAEAFTRDAPRDAPA
jgi:replicative DNA helicase